MAHVRVKQPPTVIPGQWELEPVLFAFVAEQLANGKDSEIITQLANHEYFDGVLPGILNPRVSHEGVVTDPDRRRAYSTAEIAAVCALPEVQAMAEDIRARRAAETKEQRRQARVEQLADARLAKAIKRERELVPVLLDEVAKLQTMVAWLSDQLHRANVGIGVPPAIEFVRLED